ncbi:hypothetical protein TWF718_009708 [Orbilia javanica]|uniref:Uncharacterized protein n=1 Tax=Orbilia javanica TaxID=47235 RepID=A0AAN8MMX8_9PEZI
MNGEASNVYCLGSEIGDNLIDLRDGAGAEQWLENYGLHNFEDDYTFSQLEGPQTGRAPNQKIGHNLLLADIPGVLQTHEDRLSEALEKISVLKTKMDAQDSIIKSFNEPSRPSTGPRFDLKTRLEEVSKEIKEFRSDLAKMSKRMETIESDLGFATEFCCAAGPYFDEVRDDMAKIGNLFNIRTKSQPKNGQQIRGGVK